METAPRPQISLTSLHHLGIRHTTLRGFGVTHCHSYEAGADVLKSRRAGSGPGAPWSTTRYNVLLVKHRQLKQGNHTHQESASSPVLPPGDSLCLYALFALHIAGHYVQM